jgi:hypothetical protein
MVLNATFINISVTYISWQSILLEDETGIAGVTTDLPQVTDKLYHKVVSSTPTMRWIRPYIFSGDMHLLHKKL